MIDITRNALHGILTVLFALQQERSLHGETSVEDCTPHSWKAVVQNYPLVRPLLLPQLGCSSEEELDSLRSRVKVYHPKCYHAFLCFLCKVNIQVKNL